MDIDRLQRAGVNVLDISSNPASLDNAGLGSIAGRMPPGSMLMTNSSKKPIMVIVVKWTTTMAEGSTKVKWLYLDGYYFSPLQPVLMPGGQALVTKYGKALKEQFSQLSSDPDMHGTPLKAQYSQIPGTEKATVGMIDAVIFSDGEIVGDDTSQYEQSVQRRHNMLLSVEAELHKSSSADEARTGAQQIMLQTRTSSDPADRERHQIARAVASSGDPLTFIAEFKNHSIPDKFYHSQAK